MYHMLSHWIIKSHTISPTVNLRGSFCSQNKQLFLHTWLIFVIGIQWFSDGISVLCFYKVFVTTAWRVLRLRMEERPPIWRVAVNKLNKQSRTADKYCPPAWRLGEVLTTPSREKKNCYELLMGKMLPLETKQSGDKILPHSDLRGGSVSRGGIMQQKKEKGHFARNVEC